MRSVKELLIATVWVAALVVVVTNAGGAAQIIESFGGAWFGGLAGLASAGAAGAPSTAPSGVGTGAALPSIAGSSKGSTNSRGVGRSGA